MKQVFKLVQAQAKVLADHPLFTRWLASPSISARGKLSFCPMAIDFVMGFRDLNRYYVRYPSPQDDLERALGEHAAEDSTHSSLFLQDWKLLGVDQQLGWTPREMYWWITSDDTLEARRLDFEIAAMVHHNRDPRLRFAIIESMEAAGNVFFRRTVPIAAELAAQGTPELPYFGQYHLDRESGHLQSGGEKLFFAQPLSDEQRGKASALVLRTFAIFHAHFRQWESYAQRAVTGGLDYAPGRAGRAAATLRPTPAHDVTQAMSLSHPPRPTGTGAELSEHLQAAFDDLWKHPFHRWIRKGDHAGFLPMIRSFFLQWVVDNWTCADWFLLDTPYADPQTPLERGINRLSTLYASEMRRRFVEWETLGFDALTGWSARQALEHYWLDERVEEHREVFADLRKLTLDHPSPVARYWTLKCFVRFGDALMRSLGHAMATHGVDAEAFLGFAGQPERMHPDLPPDPEADHAVFELETLPLRPEDVQRVHAIIRATHEQEARRAAITWRVLQEGRYADLGRPAQPQRAAMADFAMEQTVPAPAGAVWELLGDFGGAVRWGAPQMETCAVEGSGVGAVRTLTGRGGLEVTEKLVSYDPPRRRLSYAILEPHPLPFSDYVSTIEVIDEGSATARVRWSARYEPKDAPLEVVEGLLTQVYQENLAGVRRALGVGG
ncbi:MAG: SRPBCC family protein [Myxococcota bacterium]